VPREGLRLGDLDAKQNQAARGVATAALSACGLKMLDDIRVADDVLKAVDERKIGWDSGSYYMSVLGTPSERTPWMLQIGGHDVAYNFTFNGSGAGATPLFFGTEPIHFSAAGIEYGHSSRRARPCRISRRRWRRGLSRFGHVHRCGERRRRDPRTGKDAHGRPDTG
jgi:hypothetical protein